MRLPPLPWRCYHTPQPPAAGRPDPIPTAPIRYDLTVPRRSYPAGNRGRSIALLWSLAMRFRAPVAVALLFLLPAMSTTPKASAQPPEEEFNYDEAKVRAYTLPDLLRIPERGGPDGEAVSTPEAWRVAARARWLELLEATEYGRLLPAVPVTAEDIERGPGPDGSTRIQARLRLGVGPDSPATEVLLYLPSPSRGDTQLPSPSRGDTQLPTPSRGDTQLPTPSRGDTSERLPTFLHLNFGGNHAESADPAVRIPSGWVPNGKDTGVDDNQAKASSRGTLASRWPVKLLHDRGFATATAYCGDVFPDHADGRKASVLPSLGFAAHDGRMLSGDEPGAISTWAWQLSRILDWLVTLPEIDPTRVIVVGHSRLGKTALWAGAGDERCAMVVSNESGCGGAALERRNYGETVKRITTSFPHWFAPTFATYADRESNLPIDQHVVLAMTAPRPLYVSSAVEDRWADPRGEFLAAVAASPVWELLGKIGLGTDTYPAVDTAIGSSIGYHVRSGPHDITAVDWGHFADFATRTLAKAGR